MARHLQGSDVRGAVRLAAAATIGLADLVEAMHERIGRLPGTAAPAVPGRTGGITGLVYKTVRGVTRVVGGSVDALLGVLTPGLDAALTSAEREAVVAALNGVLGDYLVSSGNPLATSMAFYVGGHGTEPRRPMQSLPADHGGRLLVMIHGLCMNDLQWRREGHDHGPDHQHDHGEALARELGFMPLYLRYNSGLHISSNGQQLALALEGLLGAQAGAIEQVVLLCHSMGGLLARSALHYGMQARHRWPALVKDLVFLGTPHHGAPLERAGHGLDVILGATPYAAPLARLSRARSAGITDLRHGNLSDADWAAPAGAEAAAGKHLPLPVPLPQGVRCYAVAATLGHETGSLKDRLLGDGLVPLASALGRHADPQRALHFDADRQWIGHTMNHMELLGHPDVYAQLRHWLI